MKPYAPLLLAFAAATFAPATMAAPKLRFTATVPGGIIGTGNTLGLSKATGENGPGNRDSIGTFISLGNTVDNDPANPANPWPMGTTWDWKLNGSSAELDLPEAEVLYAELLWGGSYQYGTGIDDVSMLLETPVTLSANGASITVMPSMDTPMTLAEQGNGFLVRYYMRSADVTDFIKQQGKATYAVSGVPATQSTSINSLSAAGWTLVVAYRDEAATMRNLSIFVGGSFVDENATQDYSVSGFCSPPAGEVTGQLVVSSIEGDANLTGDKLQIGPNTAALADLSGPNNPVNNFFCSQINNSMGTLDTLGTFGTVNHDAINGVNTIGARQGWDVTTLSLSSMQQQLQNGQQSAVIRTTTAGDSYAPILVAFSIDVNAPDFKGAASSAIEAPTIVSQNESFKVTATLVNNGDVAAQNIKFALPLEDSLGLATFAVDNVPGDINGTTVDATMLNAGVDVGNLAKGQTKVVTMDINVLGAPKFGTFFLKAKWDYGFEVCLGKPLVPESYTQTAVINFAGGGSSSSSSGSGTGGNMGSGGSSGSGASGGAGGSTGEGGSNAGAGGSAGGGDTSGDTGTCACSVVGSNGGGMPIVPALGFLGVVALRRNRRRSS